MLLLMFHSFSLIQIGLWLYRLWYAARWQQTTFSLHSTTVAIPETFPEISVLLPVLNETDRLPQTVDFFLGLRKSYPPISLVLITTEREKRNTSIIEQTTIDIAYSLSKKYSNVYHYHYPSPDGIMAHQINFGIRQFMLEENRSVIFALYNADSRPDKQTFSFVASQFATFKEPFVVQQYGLYTSNIESLQQGSFSLAKAILTAAALWQTRWSLGFEIPHALQQFAYFPLTPDQHRQDRFWRYPLNYCIGHGLFFSLATYEELGGFSEDTFNEDAIFGLHLSAKRWPIVPVPYWELAESTDSLKGLLSQKANWFRGPADAFYYFFLLHTQFRDRRSKLRLLLMTVKLFVHALRWCLGPTLFVAQVIEACTHFSIKKLFSVLLVIQAYIFLPNLAAIQLVKSTKSLPAQASLKNICWYTYLLAFVGSLPFYFFHGLSTYISIGKFIYYTLIGETNTKQRTPMVLHDQLTRDKRTI